MNSQLIAKIKKLPKDVVYTYVNFAEIITYEDAIKYFYLITRHAQLNHTSISKMMNQFKHNITTSPFGLQVVPALTDTSKQKRTFQPWLLIDHDTQIASTEDLRRYTRQSRQTDIHDTRSEEIDVQTNLSYKNLSQIFNSNAEFTIYPLQPQPQESVLTNIQINNNFIQYPTDSNHKGKMNDKSSKWHIETPDTKKRKMIDISSKQHIETPNTKKLKMDSVIIPKQQTIPSQVDVVSTNPPIAQIKEQSSFYRNPLSSSQLLFGNPERVISLGPQELKQARMPTHQEVTENKDTDDAFDEIYNFFGYQ